MSNTVIPTAYTRECCANCDCLFEMEDWTDYPSGQYFRPVCGLFTKEKHIMALYGNLDNAMCECFTPKKGKSSNGNG